LRPASAGPRASSICETVLGRAGTCSAADDLAWKFHEAIIASAAVNNGIINSGLHAAAVEIARLARPSRSPLVRSINIYRAIATTRYFIRE